MKHSFCVAQLKKMLFAAVMTMLIMSSTDLIDNILAAQTIGSAAMAGVNLVKPLIYVAAFVTLMIATGTTYLYSFEVGAFRPEVANRLAGLGAITILCICAVVAVVAVLGESAYFACFSGAEETVGFAREYYVWYRVVLALWPLFLFMQMIVYADGGSTNCIFATMTQFAVNIVASVFFASYLDMGMVGISLGTVVGTVAAMAVFAKWIFWDSKTLKPELYFSWREIVKVIKYSYVHASLYLHIAIGNMFLNALFLQNFGEEYFPVLSVVVGILQLAVCFDGVGQAAEPLVNIYLGEGNYDGIEKVMKAATMVAVVFGAATIPFLIFLAEYIAEIFGVTEPKLLAETVTAIRILSFSMPFLAVLYLYATYYQIMGRMRIAFSLSVCKDLLFYVALPVGFALSFDLRGVWIGMMFVSVATCLLFVTYLRLRYEEDFPFLLPKSDILSRDALLAVEKVIELRNWAEAEYQKRGFTKMAQMKVGLLLEEIGMNIVENNKDTEILAELTLFFDDKPKIIIRDNGKHFDITQDNLQSFRDYFLYNFINAENIGNKFLTTQNYNRHIFQMTFE